MNNDDVITLDELVEALKNVEIYFTLKDFWACRGVARYPDELAGDLLRHVRDHREPEYVDGVAYVDAYGEYWLWDHECGSWLSFTDDPVAFSVPKRPLRRLVPEASS